MSLYEQFCQRKGLISAWRSIYNKKSKDKKKRGKDINGLTLFDYQKSYSDNIEELIKVLKAHSFTADKLKGFYKSKPGKTTKRLIGIPAINDRIVQKNILDIITPFVIPVLKNGVSFGGISKGKIRENDTKEPIGIKGAMKHFENAVSHKNYWVFKSDIESFYDRIPKEKIYKKVIKLLPDISLNTILKDIIYFQWGNTEELSDTTTKINPKIGIAQGPPLSPMLSNIYLVEFDIKMKEIYGKSFIRYADDFIVICKTEEEAKQAEKIAGELLKIEELNLSPDKAKTLITNIQTHPLIFLGLKITRQKITFKKTPGEIKSQIAALLNKKENTKLVVKNANEYIRGIFESYKFYHCKDFFQEINKMIENKRKLKKFDELKLLNLSNLKLVVTQEVWESYFKKLEAPLEV